VQRISALENALRIGKAPAEINLHRQLLLPVIRHHDRPVQKALRSARAAEVTEASAVAVAASSPESSSLIGEIKSRLEHKRRRLLIAAIDAALRSGLEGDELVVEFAPEARHYRDTMARADNANALREVCAEVCGREIGLLLFDQNSEAVASAPGRADKETKKARQAVAGIRRPTSAARFWRSDSRR
jgi:hypothetical protein